MWSNEELSCTICQQLYNTEDRTPRLLPDCGHTLCTVCLSDLLAKAEQSGEPFACSEDRTPCSIVKPAPEFPKNFALLRMLETKRAEEAATPSFECAAHSRKLELICMDHLCRICTSCALFGDHKGCNYSQEEEVVKEITLRTELLIEVYELVEGTKSNFTEHTEIENLHKEFSDKKVALRKKVSDTFRNLVTELKRKEERTLDILETNFNKIEKQMKELRDKPKAIMTEIDQWLVKVSEKMDAFDQTDPNNIAFDMLEDKDTEQDIIRMGESLLDRLHA